MQTINSSIEAPASALSLSVAADLQDHLMTACNDLDRLQDLLSGACDTLMYSFHGAAEHLIEHRRSGGAELGQVLERVQHQLSSAVTALQFQDMTSQLIQHTHRRLRNCADRLACEVFAGDEDEGIVEQAPLRPNPVTQAEMDAGSIDLF
jgi:uncharacterized protein YicC (UPF0701 family)